MMVLKKNKGIIIMMIMAVIIFISAYPYESYAAGSISTSISGGGTYEQGDKVTVRFSFTGPVEGKLAGVVSQLSFNPEVLKFESMRSASNTTILDPGVYEGITIHDLENTGSINNNGGFTSGIYNDAGVTTLGASATFEVIHPGNATVTVRSTHVGNVSLERLGNSSASTSISATKAKEPEKSDDGEEEDGSGDDQKDSSSENTPPSGSDSGSSSSGETVESKEGSNTGNESSGDSNNSGDLDERTDENETSNEASHSTGSSTFFKELVAMDIREEGWFVLNDRSNIQLEDGFEFQEIEYEAETAFSAFHEGKSITLLYFTDITGEEIRRYIYSEEDDELYPYVTLTQGIRYTFLPGVPEGGLPEGYEETQLVVNGQVLTAWQLPDETKADFYLVYAANEQGERGLYQYDQKEQTLQRFIPEAQETAPEDEAEESGFFQILQQNRMMQGTFISLSILIVIVLGATGLLAYKLNREKKKKSRRISTK